MLSLITSSGEFDSYPSNILMFLVSETKNILVQKQTKGVWAM